MIQLDLRHFSSVQDTSSLLSKLTHYLPQTRLTPAWGLLTLLKYRHRCHRKLNKIHLQPESTNSWAGSQAASTQIISVVTRNLNQPRSSRLEGLTKVVLFRPVKRVASSNRIAQLWRLWKGVEPLAVGQERWKIWLLAPRVLREFWSKRRP